MLKDFLKELFGVVLYGQTFERIFWTALAVLGGYLCWKSWQTYKAGTGEDIRSRAVVAVVLLGFGGWNALKAWTQGDGYKLFFNEPLVLHTYGVAIAIGFILAIWFAVREARRVGLDGARVMDLAFWTLIAGLVGARLVFMIVEWEEYYNMCYDPAAVGLNAPDCLAVFKIWKGGLVFYGGMLLAVFVGGFYLWKHKLPVLRYLDTCAPSVCIGSMFGRLGCLSAGCCHGSYIPSDKTMALRWDQGTAAYDVLLKAVPAETADASKFVMDQFVTAHPTQLYESGSMLVFFLFLLWLRTKKSFNGQIMLSYVIGYAIIRSVIEVFRGDKVRGHIFEWTNAGLTDALGLTEGTPLFLSTSQFISLLAVAGSIGGWVYLSKKGKERTQAILKSRGDAAAAA